MSNNNNGSQILVPSVDTEPPALPSPATPEELFPGYSKQIQALGIQQYQASKQLHSAQQAVARATRGPLELPWGPFVRQYSNWPLSVGPSAEEAKVEVEIATQHLKSLEWRLEVLHTLPGYLSSSTHSVLRSEDALNFIPNDQPQPEDMAWLARTFESMKFLTNILSDEFEGDILDAQVKITEEILSAPPLQLRAVHNLTVDELAKTFQPRRRDLPQGMTVEDLRELLSYVDLVNEHTQETDEFLRERAAAWAVEVDRLNLLRAGLVLPDEPNLTPIEFGKLLVIQPMLATVETLDKYFNLLPRPAAAKAIAEVHKGFRSADDTRTTELEKLHSYYTSLGESSWGAYARAFNEWDAPWWQKMLIEAAFDPTSYVGIGLAGATAVKIGKALSKVGLSGVGSRIGPLVYAFENGYAAAADAIFKAGLEVVLSPVKGTFWLTGAGYTLPRTYTQMSRNFARKTIMDVSAVVHRIHPGVANYKGLTVKNLQDDIGMMIQTAVDSPLEGTNIAVRAGSQLLEFNYADSVAVGELLGLPGTTVLDTAALARVNTDIIDMLSTGTGARVTSGKILGHTGQLVTEESVNKLTIRLTKFKDNLIKDATNAIRGKDPKELLINLFNRMQSIRYSNLRSPLTVHMQQAGRAASWHSRVADDILYSAGLVAMERKFVQPVARWNLLFMNFGPMNFFENMQRSWLGGAELLYPRAYGGVAETNRLFAGLSNAPYELVLFERGEQRLAESVVDKADNQPSVVGQGLVPFITKDVTIPSKLPFLGGKSIGKTINIAGKDHYIGSMQDLYDMWASLNSRQVAFDYQVHYMKALAAQAPEEMTLITSILARHKNLLEEITIFSKSDLADLARTGIQDATIGPEAFRGNANLDVFELWRRYTSKQLGKTTSRATEVSSRAKNQIHDEVLDGSMFINGAESIDERMAAHLAGEREMSIIDLTRQSDVLKEKAEAYGLYGAIGARQPLKIEWTGVSQGVQLRVEEVLSDLPAPVSSKLKHFRIQTEPTIASETGKPFSARLQNILSTTFDLDDEHLALLNRYVNTNRRGLLDELGEVWDAAEDLQTELHNVLRVEHGERIRIYKGFRHGESPSQWEGNYINVSTDRATAERFGGVDVSESEVSVDLVVGFASVDENELIIRTTDFKADPLRIDGIRADASTGTITAGSEGVITRHNILYGMGLLVQPESGVSITLDVIDRWKAAWVGRTPWGETITAHEWKALWIGQPRAIAPNVREAFAETFALWAQNPAGFSYRTLETNLSRESLDFLHQSFPRLSGKNRWLAFEEVAARLKKMFEAEFPTEPVLNPAAPKNLQEFMSDLEDITAMIDASGEQIGYSRRTIELRKQELSVGKARDAFEIGSAKQMEAFMQTADEELGKLMNQLQEYAKGVDVPDLGLGERLVRPRDIQDMKAEVERLVSAGQDREVAEKIILGEDAEKIRVIRDFTKVDEFKERMTLLGRNSKTLEEDVSTAELRDWNRSRREFGVYSVEKGTRTSTIENLISKWFANSDNKSLQQLGRLATEDETYRQGVQDLLREQYPSGYIRIFRGGGQARAVGQDPLEREFTNATSSKSTALDFSDTWVFEELGTGREKRAFTPKDIDNVVIRVEDVVSVGSVVESELIIPSAVLLDRINNPITPTMLSEPQMARLADLDTVTRRRLNNVMETRTRNARIDATASTTPSRQRNKAFWEKQTAAKNDSWNQYFAAENQLKSMDLMARRHFLTSVDQPAFVPSYVPDVVDQLTPDHLAHLFGVTGDDLYRGLTRVQQHIVVRPREDFILYAMNQADTYAMLSGKTAADIGFTNDAVGEVYDQLWRNLGIEPSTLTPDSPTVMQLDDIRQELHRLYAAGKLPEADAVKFSQYMNRVADDLEQLPMYKAAEPVRRTRDAQEQLVVNEIEQFARSMPGRKLWYHGGPDIEGELLEAGYVADNIQEAIEHATEHARKGEPGEAFVYVIDEADTLLGPSHVPGLASEREILAPTKAVRAFDVLKDYPQEVGVSGRDKWFSQKESAMSTAREQHALSHPTYDDSNMVEEGLRAVFPFANYELFRWRYIPRTWMRTPGTMVNLARWTEYSDEGYIPIPFTDLQLNPLRGSIWMGGLRSLFLKDYPEYYDAMPGMEGIDYIGRLGFFPGIHVMAPIVLYGATKGGKPELAEITPAFAQSGLSALRALSPEHLGKVINFFYPDRFRDFQTMLTVGEMGYDADEIWRKIQQDIKLTSEEEKLWLQAGNKANGIKGILMQQTGLFRIRPQEYTVVRQEMRLAIEEATGVPVPVQERIDRLYPTTGKRLSDYYKLDILQQKLLYEWETYRRWRGVSTSLFPSGWQALDIKIADYFETLEEVHNTARLTGLYEEGELVQPSIVEINRQRVEKEIGPDQWLSMLNSIWSGLAEATRVLGESPAYKDVPKNLEEREELLRSRGILTPTYGPDQELLWYYYELKPAYKWDWDAGRYAYDYETYYAQVDILLDSLSTVQRERLLARVQLDWTPMERLHWQVSRDFFRPYRNIRSIILNQYDDLQRQQIRRFEVARGEERQALQELGGPDGQKLIAGFDTAVREAREQLRLIDPTLDAWLSFFGKTDTTKTGAAAEELANMNNRYLTTSMIQ